MPAAILGDRASGKTSFLGLLYATQVNYGTGPRDTFRFHAPLQSLNIMDAVYRGMMEGRFPGATLKDEITELAFLFGYQRALGGALPVWIREQHWANPFSVLRFAAYDVSGEDVQEFIESGVAASSVIKQLLKSTIVCILVDCGKMTEEIDTPGYKKMLKYDGDIAKLLVSFQQYKQEEYERMRVQGIAAPKPVIYPALVLTKFDTIRDEMKSKAGLPLAPPPFSDRRKRKDFAEALLRSYLRQSLSQLRGGKIAGVSFDQAAYFFSHVKTEVADGGMAPVGTPRIVRKRGASGTEIDYAFQEYVSFIEHFRGIANLVPDEVEEKDAVAKK